MPLTRFGPGGTNERWPAPRESAFPKRCSRPRMIHFSIVIRSLTRILVIPAYLRELRNVSTTTPPVSRDATHFPQPTVSVYRSIHSSHRPLQLHGLLRAATICVSNSSEPGVGMCARSIPDDGAEIAPRLASSSGPFCVSRRRTGQISQLRISLIAKTCTVLATSRSRDSNSNRRCHWQW